MCASEFFKVFSSCVCLNFIILCSTFTHSSVVSVGLCDFFWFWGNNKQLNNCFGKIREVLTVLADW